MQRYNVSVNITAVKWNREELAMAHELVEGEMKG